LRKKPRDSDNEPLNSSKGSLSSSIIEEKHVKNENKPKGLLLFSTIEEKKTKDDNELGSQFVIIVGN
jgi:hypothetical protein